MGVHIPKFVAFWQVTTTRKQTDQDGRGFETTELGNGCKKRKAVESGLSQNFGKSFLGLTFCSATKRLPMANTTFLLDALVVQPAETLAWLQVCCDHSCDAVASDVASAMTALNLTRDLGIKQCRTSARAQAKLATAALEGLRNVAAALDAIASLCASAMAASADSAEAAFAAALEEGRRARHLVLALQGVHCHGWSVESDVNADVGELGLHFQQWVDIAALAGCQLACVVDQDKDKGLTWPRGQHSFTLHANVMTPDLTTLPTFWLPHGAVTVDIHGDDRATWTCAQHQDGCGVVITYTAAWECAEVQLTVHALGAAMFTQRLVGRGGAGPYLHLLLVVSGIARCVAGLRQVLGKRRAETSAGAGIGSNATLHRAWHGPVW